jgi:hypothetical protein
MSLVIENPHADAARRERESMATAPRTGRALPKGKTALAIALSDHQTAWLAQYATDQWNAYWNALYGWRTKLKKFERVAESNNTDRQGAPNPDHTRAPKTIFDQSNRSLGLVSGFADFAFAQARDDIFGTTPWFAATPEGVADENLATTLTRHAHWKFHHTSVKECFIDCLKLACDLGTSFPKLSWRREIETFQSIKQVAHDEAGQPLVKMDGTYVTPDDEEAQMAASWQEMLVEDQVTVFDNVEARAIDYNDIAFNPTAPELDLVHTDVFHRFQIGLLDAKQIYGLTDEQYDAALSLIHGEQAGVTDPRENRAESRPLEGHRHEEDANPSITLVEGFLRVNPFGKAGSPIRVWCVFSPALQTIFSLDYLANQTPGGILPVHAIPWFKIPNRIMGKGYFERFEDVNDFIDEQFNLTVHRDRLAADPVGGYDAAILDEDMEETEIIVSPGKLFKLKPGMKITDFLQFADVPQPNNRAVDLMQQMMQVAQLRTGITSASQGELTGMPEVNTATGINQIISRGATLLKWPIDTIKDALAGPLDTAIQLLYANQEIDETFTWSEGRAPELMEIKRNDVRGLRLNVRLTMTQSQNQNKLQNAQFAIQFIQQYIVLPEPEKVATRSVFIQALQALSFQGADQIIREPVTDPMGIAALLPPEMQEPFLMWAQQMGLIAAPAEHGTEGETGITPITEPANTEQAA